MARTADASAERTRTLPPVCCAYCAHCRVTGHGGWCRVGHGTVGDVSRGRQCIYHEPRRARGDEEDESPERLRALGGDE